MKHIIPLIIILVAILACKSSEQNISKQTTPTPKIENIDATPTEKSIIDIPTLANKTEKEVESILGKPVTVDKLNKTDTTGEISWDYKFGEDSVFINFKKGKANYFHFVANQSYENVLNLENW